MYSTKLLHKNMMSNNAYLHKGDVYRDPQLNPFRQSSKPKKGDGDDEKKEKPFMTAVSFNIDCCCSLSDTTRTK